MSLSNLLYDGVSLPQNHTLRQRFCNWLGYLRTKRKKGVTVPRSCRISPDAWINSRRQQICFGENCDVAPGAMVQGSVHMGDCCSVQANAVLVGCAGGEIQIGSYVRIATQTVVVGANHVFDRTDLPICRQGMRPAPIVIEDDVWIGAGVRITAGVHIGTGCVIGAGAVVTKDIPPFSLAAGVPARVIKSRLPQ